MSESDEKPADNERRSLRTDNRIEASELSLELLGSARRRLDILVYDYDDILLPPASMQELLTRFIHGHDRNQFRLLCSETRHLRDKGGVLIDFAQRFSTFIKLRQVPEEYRPVTDQFIIADDNASLRQHDFTVPSYFVSFNDRASVRPLHNRFEDLWQRSAAVPGIHVTGLSG
jgi:hypothetical protein